MGQGQKAIVNSAAPFLSKCYEVVNDPQTDSIVSWTDTNDTFVVWDYPAFARDLLPKYFKHSNFSSFVRQLNTYGFRKVNPDRWEFANDGFQKGQIHLLKTIARKKACQGLQFPQSQPAQFSRVRPCVEVGKFGLQEEVERLKRDKNVLMQELVKVRQHQQNVEKKLRVVVQQLQQMELNQQQMLSFFALAMQKPGFLAKLMQQNGKGRPTVRVNKKKCVETLEPDSESPDATSSALVVKYRCPTNDIEKPLLMPISNATSPLQSDHRSEAMDDLFMDVDLEALGVDLAIPMEGDLLTSTAAEMMTFSDMPNNFIEQLLLESWNSENNDNSGSDGR